MVEALTHYAYRVGTVCVSGTCVTWDRHGAGAVGMVGGKGLA